MIAPIAVFSAFMAYLSSLTEATTEQVRWMQVGYAWQSFWRSVDRSTFDPAYLVQLDVDQESGALPPTHFFDAMGQVRPKAQILPHDRVHPIAVQLPFGEEVDALDWEESTEDAQALLVQSLEEVDRRGPCFASVLEVVVSRSQTHADHYLLRFDPPVQVSLDKPLQVELDHQDESIDPLKIVVHVAASPIEQEWPRIFEALARQDPWIHPARIWHWYCSILPARFEVQVAVEDPGPLDLVEWMPPYLRVTYLTVVRDRGSEPRWDRQGYPNSGSVRFLMHPDDAEALRQTDEAWTEILRPSTDEDRRTYPLRRLDQFR